MKVLKDGKEVKDAKVTYDVNGGAQYVTVEGVNYDPKAFELVEDKATKQTKPAETKTKQTKVAAESKTKQPESGVMSTGDVNRK